MDLKGWEEDFVVASGISAFVYRDRAVHSRSRLSWWSGIGFTLS